MRWFVRRCARPEGTLLRLADYGCVSGHPSLGQGRGRPGLPTLALCSSSHAVLQAIDDPQHGIDQPLPRALWGWPALGTDTLGNAVGTHGDRGLLAKSTRTYRSPPV